MNEQINKRYYTGVYSSRSMWLFYLHASVSYVQKSKARANRSMLAELARIHAGETGFRVLDYGCGWGASMFALPKTWRYHGYDIADDVTERLAHVMPWSGRRFEIASVSPSGVIAPHDLDLIICSHVMEHVPDDAAVLRQFHAALKGGAHLLINVPINELVFDPYHVRKYDRESLSAALRAAGFAVVAETETVKLSGWFRAVEKRRWGRLVTRPLRLLFGILPHGAAQVVDRTLLRRWPNQHLVVLARKFATPDHGASVSH